MSSDKDLVYKLAFSFLKKRIPVFVLRELEEREIFPEDFFNLPSKELIQKSGIKPDPAFDKLSREEAVAIARKELSRINNHGISPLFVFDEDYPFALSQIDDPPIILYKLGEASLDGEHNTAVVGTRKPSPYGLDFCNKFVGELGEYFPDCNIVSGLAFGIDAAAHKKALEMNLTTTAVVAHGLNMIYPAANRNLAKEIIHAGGAIVSEYPFDTKPFKPNFLARNRIVAGLSDVTVIVESKIKGGAMCTANFAFMYNREVMALPGRISDEQSAGCNLLINRNKAHLLQNVADLIEITGWKPCGIQVERNDRNLFPELTGDSKLIYEKLKSSTEPITIDSLVQSLSLSPSRTLSSLSEMEFDGIVIRYPGNRYSIS